MKKMKGKIAVAILLASGFTLLTGCNNDTGREDVVDVTESEGEKDTYTITFVTGTDDTPLFITAKAGESITLPMDITKEGYTFKGWFTDETHQTSFASLTMPKKNLTLYAYFEENVYSFKLSTGSVSTTYTLKYNEKLPEISIPSKEGYTFMGWSEEIPDTMPSHDLSITALWSKNTYTVTIHPNNGDEDIVLTLGYDEVIAYPVLSKEGYTFLGYDSYAPSIMPSYNLEMTALWSKNTYDISYNTNGGTLEGDLKTSYTIEDSFTLPTPTKKGYVFNGWYKESTFNTYIDKIENNAENLNLYAKWEIKTYTLTYDMNGGEEAESIELSYGAEIPYPDTVRKGYSFDSWENYAKTMPEHDLTVKALWSIITYSITYHETDGGLGRDVIKAESYDAVWSYTIESENYVLPVLKSEKSGYQFKGWYTSADLNEESRITEIPKGTTGNIDLYPKWEYVSYTISYDAAEGTINEEYKESFTIMDGFALPSDVTRTGYTFTGWYDENGNQVTEVEQSTTEDLSFTALWEKNTYTITYYFLDGDKNGEVMDSSYFEDDAKFSYSVTDEVALVKPSRTGYEFDTMYFDMNKENLAEEIPLGTVGNISIYVTYEKTEYVITYNVNGGTINGDYETTFTVTDEVTLPSSVTKGGCTFSGWYQDGNLVTKIASGTTENITLEAKYVLTAYTITYDANGGTFTENGNSTYQTSYDISMSTPKPVRNGYGFIGSAKNTDDSGWYLDSNCTEAFTITEDTPLTLTLYAKWEKYITVDSTGILTSVDMTIADKYEEEGGFIIPSSVDGYNVTSIGESAFYLDMDNPVHPLSKVTIPSTVITIGKMAFCNQTSLSSVALPSSVTTIGNYAFSCSGLESITIPSSVTSIGSGAFSHTNLTSISFNSSILTIPESVCEGCTSLRYVTILCTDDYLELSENAFKDCSSLYLISYAGTKALWYGLSEVHDWDSGTDNYLVEIGTGDSRNIIDKEGNTYCHLYLYYNERYDRGLLYEGYFKTGTTVDLSSLKYLITSYTPDISYYSSGAAGNGGTIYSNPVTVTEGVMIIYAVTGPKT